LNKNLHQLKEYGSQRILTKFSGKKWQNEGLNTLLKKIRETRITDHRHQSGRPKQARTEENVTLWMKL